jgi:hypothetical protein
VVLSLHDGCPTMRLTLGAAPSRRASNVPGFGGVGLHQETRRPSCTAVVATVETFSLLICRICFRNRNLWLFHLQVLVLRARSLQV